MQNDTQYLRLNMDAMCGTIQFGENRESVLKMAEASGRGLHWSRHTLRARRAATRRSLRWRTGLHGQDATPPLKKQREQCENGGGARR